MMTKMDDAELIERIVARDAIAFEMIYQRYAGRALSFALRMIAERSIAEEIVQEAFWRVWKRSSSFSAVRGSLSTWIMGIVHHLAIDELRHRRGQAPVMADDLDSDVMDAVPAYEPDVLEQVEAGMQRTLIREALGQLSGPQRNVIELAYFQSYTHQEIAAKLQEPIGTIHTRARLALIRLRLPYRNRVDGMVGEKHRVAG